MSDFEQITYEVSNRIATLTLNRPDKLNAFTGQMVFEVCKAFDLADADDDVAEADDDVADVAVPEGARVNEGDGVNKTDDVQS